MTQICGLLLAGGESSRMGRDKALLPWAGTTLLEHQLTTLRSTGAREVFISARDADKYAHAGAPIICDEGARCGPLGGLCTALTKIGSPLLLVLAIDLPAMSSAFLRALVDEAQPTRGVVPQRGRFFEPLAAVYPIEAAEIAANQIAHGQFAMQAFVRELIAADLMESRALFADEERFFANFNHPVTVSRAI